MNYYNEYEQTLFYYKKLLNKLGLNEKTYTPPSSIVFGKDLVQDDLWHTRKRLQNLEFLILKQRSQKKD